VLGYAIVRSQRAVNLLEGSGIKPLDLARTGRDSPAPAPVMWYINYFDVRSHQERRQLLSRLPARRPLVSEVRRERAPRPHRQRDRGSPFVIAASLTGGDDEGPFLPGVVDASNLVDVTEYKQYFLSRTHRRLCRRRW
jgi:hypothetical protein